MKKTDMIHDGAIQRWMSRVFLQEFYGTYLNPGESIRIRMPQAIVEITPRFLEFHGK